MLKWNDETKPLAMQSPSRSGRQLRTLSDVICLHALSTPIPRCDACVKRQGEGNWINPQKGLDGPFILESWTLCPGRVGACVPCAYLLFPTARNRAINVNHAQSNARGSNIRLINEFMTGSREGPREVSGAAHPPAVPQFVARWHGAERRCSAPFV